MIRIHKIGLNTPSRLIHLLSIYFFTIFRFQKHATTAASPTKSDTPLPSTKPKNYQWNQLQYTQYLVSALILQVNCR